jgi:anti-sigma factor RsiW
VSQLQSGHLGDLGAALVDDQLSPDARDAALAHLASCPDCQRDVEQQRRLKARLALLSEPSLPMALAMRLSALKPEPAGLPAAPPPPTGGPTLLSQRPSQRRGRLLVGAASVLLFGVGTGVAAAADGQPVPARPASNVLTTGGNRVVTTAVSVSDPAFSVMNASLAP